MHPQAPDFTSPAPGSAWFEVQLVPGQPPLIYRTQYDALLRLFQAKAKQLLPAIYLFDREQGRCPTGPLEGLSIAWNATLRRSASLPVDGRFGPETQDALGYLLCATGQTEAARQYALALRAGTVPAETLRQMFWFTEFVRSVGSASDPAFEAAVDGARITALPSTTVLPTLRTMVDSDPRDRLWMAAARLGVDPTPIAPSQAASAVRPPPPAPTAPKGFSSLELAGIGVVALLGGYALASQK